jgi:serine/threonine protein kinase
MSVLNIPAIIRVHQIFIDKMRAQSHLVMEFAAGSTLDHLFK